MTMGKLITLLGLMVGYVAFCGIALLWCFSSIAHQHSLVDMGKYKVIGVETRNGEVYQVVQIRK